MISCYIQQSIVEIYQFAGFGPVVEGKGEPLQMLVEIVPDPGHGAATCQGEADATL